MTAHEAALEKAANTILRRLLAYNKSFNCADVKIGGSAPFYKAVFRKSAPRRRGPEQIRDIDETGATVELQGQTFKIARYCARK